MNKRTVTSSLFLLLFTTQLATGTEVQFKVVGTEPPADRYRSCRQMLVGPWHNQPEEYQGYNGFVGWAGVTRLRSGQWLVAFTSGTWHVTPPWTDEVRKDPAAVQQFKEWNQHPRLPQKMGLPDIDAPRGGRAHIMHSDDEGRTWSKPQTLIDTEDDDRHPAILELDDGTLLCTFFTWRLPRVAHAKHMISHDGGKSWTDPTGVPGNPMRSSLGNGSAIQLSDGSVVWVVEGRFDPSLGHNCIGVLRSTDRARNFELAAIIKTDHPMNEPTVAEVAPGHLVMVARREGDVSWSNDGGKTWTQSSGTDWNLFDPHLVIAPNGVLALFHGSYKAGALRVLLSPDGGHTWHGPGEWIGYSVDPSVYGYCHPMVLPDGTIYVTYLHTGGHLPADARTEALWGLRVRVHDDAGGIDILPAPGSPAARGQDATGLERFQTQGGDPELGNLPESTEEN
mgnify:FL=1